MAAGKTAVKAFETSVSAAGIAAKAYRLADTGDALATGNSSVKKQPGDFVFFYRYFGGIIEVKETEDPHRFHLKNIRDSQWQAAVRARAGMQNYAFFILCLPTMTAYIVAGEQMLKFKEVGLASVQWVLLEPFKLTSAHKGKEWAYDLVPLVMLWRQHEATQHTRLTPWS